MIRFIQLAINHHHHQDIVLYRTVQVCDTYFLLYLYNLCTINKDILLASLKTPCTK